LSEVLIGHVERKIAMVAEHPRLHRGLSARDSIDPLTTWD
jgi:hypothetical protein